MKARRYKKFYQWTDKLDIENAPPVDFNFPDSASDPLNGVIDELEGDIDELKQNGGDSVLIEQMEEALEEIKNNLENPKTPEDFFNSSTYNQDQSADFVLAQSLTPIEVKEIFILEAGTPLPEVMMKELGDK